MVRMINICLCLKLLFAIHILVFFLKVARNFCYYQILEIPKYIFKQENLTIAFSQTNVAMAAIILPCVNITPLGKPVVPDVYIINAKLSLAMLSNGSHSYCFYKHQTKVFNRECVSKYDSNLATKNLKKMKNIWCLFCLTF